MRSTYTYTYALLEIPKSAYDAVIKALEAADYEFEIGDDGEIDMHGIALVVEETPR